MPGQKKEHTCLDSCQGRKRSVDNPPSNFSACWNVTCPSQCDVCQIIQEKTKCIRSFACCPDSTKPIPCVDNPCKSIDLAKCGSEKALSNLVCYQDSCGSVCKAVVQSDAPAWASLTCV
uniref:Uncharacterized protein n=1 Tax=Romanomermis culicivorax TaxID=13658 RepID=A0A915KBH2_ROMCU